MTQFGDRLMLIGGELVASEGGEWITSVNPATEQVIGRAPAGTAADVDRAYDAAAAAQPEWAAKSIWQRAGYLHKLAAAIRERGEEILQLEASDTGNTIKLLAGDIVISSAMLQYYAGLGTEIKGDTVPASGGQNIHFTLREPYGVTARIVPFNHPFMFEAAAIAAPIMAGNAVIIKTPETSPLSGGILAELCQEIFPPGIVNLVSGYGIPVGDRIARHPKIRRIGFTGSVGTALAIQRSAAETCIKHITLELGGKNAMIVCADADPDAVTKAAIGGMNFAWAGQSCGSVSRLMVHESIYDDVVERVAAKVSALKLGDPLDPTSEMGPVNNKAHYDRILSFMASAKQEGAKTVTGGDIPKGEQFERGFWVEPTVYGDVTMDMRVGKEEIFGPVISAIKWSKLDEVIAMANAVDYGLTGAVWTNDLQVAMTTARALETGLVWINGTQAHYVGTPFGGWKDSGLGREECVEELVSYTQSKAIHILL